MLKKIENFEENAIFSLRQENKTKDEIIEKASKIIEILQKELETLKKNSEFQEIPKKNIRKSSVFFEKNEVYNKKLQIPRSLRLFREKDGFSEKIDAKIDEKYQLLQEKLEKLLEKNEKLQNSLKDKEKKLEFLENSLKNVIFSNFFHFSHFSEFFHFFLFIKER